MSALSVAWSPIIEIDSARYIFLALGSKVGVVTLWCFTLPVGRSCGPVYSGAFVAHQKRTWITSLACTRSGPKCFYLAAGSSDGAVSIWTVQVKTEQTKSANLNVRSSKVDIVGSGDGQNTCPINGIEWCSVDGSAGPSHLVAYGKGACVEVCQYSSESGGVVRRLRKWATDRRQHKMNISSLWWMKDEDHIALVTSGMEGKSIQWIIDISDQSKSKIEPTACARLPVSVVSIPRSTALKDGCGQKNTSNMLPMARFGSCSTPDQLLVLGITQTYQPDHQVWMRSHESAPRTQPRTRARHIYFKRNSVI